MKKTLALAALLGVFGLALLALSNLPGSQAFATTAPMQRWVSDQLVWRHSNLTTVSNPAALDSMAVRHGTAVAGGYVASTALDTSIAYNLNQCELNTSWLGATTGVDTLALFSVNLYPTGNTSFTPTTGDSLAIALQVSMDGINWSKVTATVNQAVVVQDGATQQEFNVALPANQHKGFTRFYFQKTDILGRTNIATAATAPTDGQYFGWRWVRFIISPNRLNGEWGGWLSYWSSRQYANQ
jgi:hypothetical protein